MRQFYYLLFMSAFMANAPLWASQKQKAKTEENKEPIKYRCDLMKGSSQSNVQILKCKNNVVLIQKNTTICCDELTIEFKDKELNTILCTGKAKAKRGLENIWAEKITYYSKEDSFEFEGNPRMQKGVNFIRGRKIILYKDTEEAKVLEPQGEFLPSEPEEAIDISLNKKLRLPKKCNLKPAPKQ